MIDTLQPMANVPLGLQFGLVKQPVYTITAKLVLIGKPIPRKHFKLAYNRRRQDLQTISKVLKRLMAEYARIHVACMPATIDDKPVNVEPFGSIHFDEPKTFDEFRSPRMKHAQTLFEPTDYSTVTRRVTILFMAPTYAEAVTLNGWINRQGEAWPTACVGAPVNQGLYSVICAPKESTITMQEGTFLSLAEIFRSPTPPATKSVQ